MNENIVGKYSSGYKKAKHDLEVIRKVEKFGDILENPYVYKLFVYDAKKRQYDVITRQVNKFEIPFYEEGFDFIDIVVDGNCNYREMQIPDIDQKNPHHKLTLKEHSERVFLNLKSDNDALLLAAYYHDIGKIYTQSFDEKGIAHYYHHANVGTYEVLTHGFDYPKYTGRHDWSSDCLEILFYINYHMRPFD